VQHESLSYYTQKIIPPTLKTGRATGLANKKQGKPGKQILTARERGENIGEQYSVLEIGRRLVSTLAAF
jgi:hypothetical protein